MAQTWLNRPELFLINNWSDVQKLEDSVASIRQKYKELLEKVIGIVREKHRYLDYSAFHLKPGEIGQVALSKNTWPRQYESWPTGFYLDHISLEELSSEIKGTKQYAYIWVRPTDTVKIDRQEAKNKIARAMKRLMSKQEQLLCEEDDEEGSGVTCLSYPLSENGSDLLKMLCRNNAKEFIDCIVSHFELLARFTPVVDEVCKKHKK